MTCKLLQGYRNYKEKRNQQPNLRRKAGPLGGVAVLHKSKESGTDGIEIALVTIGYLWHEALMPLLIEIFYSCFLHRLNQIECIYSSRGSDALPKAKISVAVGMIVWFMFFEGYIWGFKTTLLFRKMSNW